MRIGPEASKEQTRLTKLLPKLMKLGRAGSRSDRAYDETVRLLDTITPGVEMFPRSADDQTPENATSPGSAAVAVNASSDGSSEESYPSTLTSSVVLLIEPPISRTKGRNPGQQKKDEVQPDGNPLSTYTTENYGNRECSTCHVRGTHYSTTCPLNPNRSKAAEARSNKRGAKTQAGQPRKRGRPKIVRDLHEEQSDDDNAVSTDYDDQSQEEEAPTQESIVANKRGRKRGGAALRGRGKAVRGRRTRAARVNYME